MTDVDEFQRHQFTQPVRQILTMMALVGLAGVGAYFIAVNSVVEEVFRESPYLNGFIVAVFICGLSSCFWQVLTLVQSVSWIEGFARNRPGHELVRPPGLLAPLAALLRKRGARTSLTTFSARSILDSVATRLDEGREITRYIINLLIFLGLLGTFYGLAITVPAVVDTIRSLAPAGQDEGGIGVFEDLMQGLERQLGGMGTAFGSSLLGLAGSLVVGLLDLFAGHGQNRFYRELEDWISSITRISVSDGDGEALPIAGDPLNRTASPGFAGADAVRANEQWMLLMNRLNEVLVQLDDRRAASEGQVERIANLVERMTGVQAGQASQVAPEVFGEIAASQRQIADAISRRASEELTLDTESRSRLRSIDNQMLRLLEDMAVARQDTIADLRGDLAVLINTLQEAVRTDEKD